MIMDSKQVYYGFKVKYKTGYEFSYSSYDFGHVMMEYSEWKKFAPTDCDIIAISNIFKFNETNDIKMNTDFTFCEGARGLIPCPLREGCERFIEKHENLPEKIWQFVEPPFKRCSDDKTTCYEYIEYQS